MFSLLALLTRALADRFEFFVDQPGRPRALHQRGDVPGLRADRLTDPADQRPLGRQPAAADRGRAAAGHARAGSSSARPGWCAAWSIGILGAFAAGGAVIGTGKTYAASLGGGDATYGILFGAVFVGLGLGMGLGPRVARDLSRRRLFGLSIIFAGTCLVLVALMPHLVLSLICVIGVGFGAGTAYLSGTTLLGREVADEVRGRTFAFVQSLVRVDLILTLAAAPFVVGLLRQRTVDAGVVDFTVDGTRILLVLAGLLAIGGGIVSYRQMDDRTGVPVVSDLVSALRGDTTTRRRLSKGGMLIAFEGGEGSGKSTQAARLAEWLTERGVAVTTTHEPGATDFGVRIRQILLDSPDGSLTPRAEALLFAADRAHHVDTVIRPALDRGDVVITDRYVDSSLAYQGAGRALAVDDIRRLSRWATGGLRPDLTVLLDIDPEFGLERARAAGHGHDRVERESLEFHQRVREGFRALADAAPDQYLVVDAGGHPGDGRDDDPDRDRQAARRPAGRAAPAARRRGRRSGRQAAALAQPPVPVAPRRDGGSGAAGRPRRCRPVGAAGAEDETAARPQTRVAGAPDAGRARPQLDPGLDPGARVGRRAREVPMTVWDEVVGQPRAVRRCGRPRPPRTAS